MSEYPIEKQVITQPQAVQLAGLLGDDAPGSVWGWVKYEHRNDYVLELTSEVMHDNLADYYYHAYTGDELGVLLPKRIFYKTSSHASYYSLYSEYNSSEFSFWYNTRPWQVPKIFSAKIEAQAKADLAIDVLDKGWIKKEDFKYE